MPHATMFETISSVTACTDALQVLLSKSAKLRPKPGFKRAITEAELKPEIDSIFGRSKEEAGDLQGLSSVAIDAAFKRVLYGILAKNTIQEPGFSQVWHLLDIANMLSYREQSEPSLTMGLAEELFESQTTEGCRTVFEYLETRQDIMFRKSWKDKQQITLRVCNELLRRFSRADNSVFCGRIFIYLFQVFPLGDRSSVNLRGTYHTANRTIWDQSIDPQENGEEMIVDEVKAETSNGDAPTQITITPAGQVNGNVKDPEKEVLDLDTLYPIFWSLQDYFSNPKSLFEPANLTLFKAGLEAVLAKFQQIQQSNESRPASTSETTDAKVNTKRKWSEVDEESSEGLLTFNPKYLTSRDLFSLEMSSLTFRRHVLVQALILLEFLLFQTSSGREKQNLPIADPSNPGKNLRPNASAVYSFELPEEETTWASSKKSEIASYLSHGQEGKSYYQMVDTVLSRDKNWVFWKAHNCLEFVLPPLEPQKFLDAQKSAIKSATAQRLKASPMGAFDISFLHDPEGQKVLTRLANPKRTEYPPPLSTMESQLLELDFDLSAVERATEGADEGEADADEDGPLQRKRKLLDLQDSLKWRALRVGIRRGRLKWFDRVDGENGKMDALFHNPVVSKKEDNDSETKVEADSESKDNEDMEEDSKVDTDADTRDEKDTEEIKDAAMQDADADTNAVAETKSDINEQDPEPTTSDQVPTQTQAQDADQDQAIASADDTQDHNPDSKGEPIPVFEFGDDS